MGGWWLAGGYDNDHTLIDRYKHFPSFVLHVIQSFNLFNFSLSLSVCPSVCLYLHCVAGSISGWLTHDATCCYNVVGRHWTRTVKHQNKLYIWFSFRRCATVQEPDFGWLFACFFFLHAINKCAVFCCLPLLGGGLFIIF